MGSSNSTLLGTPRRTERFLPIIKEEVERDVPGTDKEKRKKTFRAAVTLHYYVASNLRCQWFSNPRVRKTYFNGEWRATAIRNVHDGVYALFLIYAAKGMCTRSLIMLPYIREEMQLHGLRTNHVCWTADLNNHDTLGPHYNDWLLEEMELKDALAPGIELHDRVKLCRDMIKAATIMVEDKYEQEGFSLDLLTRAIRHAADTCVRANAPIVGRYYLDIVGQPQIAFLFFQHYSILSGGRRWESDTAGSNDVEPPNCKKAGILAAVFCSILLAEGEDVVGLTNNQLFSKHDHIVEAA